MAEFLMAVVRCDCGGRLQQGTERTERGPRWTFACERCGCRWGHRDGVFGPLDREPGDGSGGLAPAESELLAWFRRLPGELRCEALSHVRSLSFK